MSARPVTRIVVPKSLSDPSAEPFLAITRLANAVSRHDAGHPFLDQDARQEWGFWRDTTDWEHVGFAVSAAGGTIGVGTLNVSTQPGTRTAEYFVLIDPEYPDQEAEAALYAALDQEARDRGLHTLHTWTLHHPHENGPRVASPTGWGSVPADDPQTKSVIRHGASLQQVERVSAFDLRSSLSHLEPIAGDALARAGDGYRVREWTGDTPAAFLDSFAHTLSRMSTDAPQGGLDIEEQRWDAERVRRRDARLRDQGLTVSVVAVEHVASGAIAAYNELVLGEDPTASTQQYGTLVLAEHRGRRLGTVVKCANLLRWRAIAPRSPRVITFNAAENRYMLSINEQLGFVPVSIGGAWQKTLE